MKNDDKEAKRREENKKIFVKQKAWRNESYKAIIYA